MTAADSSNVPAGSGARLARYAEAVRTMVRGHHPRCFRVRPEGIPDDLPRDLCDCRILWMLTAGSEHQRAEAAEAERDRLREAVEALADEFKRRQLRNAAHNGNVSCSVWGLAGAELARALADAAPDPMRESLERGLAQVASGETRKRDDLLAPEPTPSTGEGDGGHGQRLACAYGAHQWVRGSESPLMRRCTACGSLHAVTLNEWLMLPTASSADDKAGEGK